MRNQEKSLVGMCLEKVGLLWRRCSTVCSNSHLTYYTSRTLQSCVEHHHTLVYSQGGIFNSFGPACTHACGHRNPIKGLPHCFLVSSRDVFRLGIPDPFLAFSFSLSPGFSLGGPASGFFSLPWWWLVRQCDWCWSWRYSPSQCVCVI